jgi:hypothetical protein
MLCRVDPGCPLGIVAGVAPSNPKLDDGNKSNSPILIVFNLL